VGVREDSALVGVRVDSALLGVREDSALVGVAGFRISGGEVDSPLHWVELDFSFV